MKVAVQYAPPFTFAALRVLLGAVCLFALLIGLRKPILPKEVVGTFAVGVLQTAGVYGLANWALVSGGAGKVSVLVYTMPLWTLLLAAIVLHERIQKLQWIAIALSITGLLLILDPSNLGGTTFSKFLALLAGLSWAAGAIIAKKLRQTIELDLLSFTAWQTLFAALPLALIALLTPAHPIQWTAPFIFSLVYNVVPGTAIATLLWLYILHNLSAGTAGLGILLNPVLAVLAAWIQLGERPGFLEAIGMGVIAIALLLNAIQAIQPVKPVEES
jgi:drug/metabolite transporter (DMT)-like permease